MSKKTMQPISADVHAALCFALWHHQGGSSAIGQPIREMLGLGQHDHMTSEQYFDAKRVAEALHMKQKPAAAYSDIVSDGGLDPRNAEFSARECLIQAFSIVMASQSRDQALDEIEKLAVAIREKGRP